MRGNRAMLKAESQKATLFSGSKRFNEKIEAETWEMKAGHDGQSEGRWQRNPLCLPLAWSSSEKLGRLNCQLDLSLS